MWTAVLAGSFGCYALKLAGVSVPQRVLDDARVQRIGVFLPVALLSALVATQTFTTGQRPHPRRPRGGPRRRGRRGAGAGAVPGRDHRGLRLRRRSSARSPRFSPMSCRAVTFDFNGTLSDDEQILFGVYAELFAEHGRPLRRRRVLHAARGSLRARDRPELAGRPGRPRGDRPRADRPLPGSSDRRLDRVRSDARRGTARRLPGARGGRLGRDPGRDRARGRRRRPWRGVLRDRRRRGRDAREAAPGELRDWLSRSSRGTPPASSPARWSRSRTPRRASPRPRPPECAASRSPGRSPGIASRRPTRSSRRSTSRSCTACSRPETPVPDANVSRTLLGGAPRAPPAPCRRRHPASGAPGAPRPGGRRARARARASERPAACASDWAAIRSTARPSAPGTSVSFVHGHSSAGPKCSRKPRMPASPPAMR